MEYLTSLREQYKNDHFIPRTREPDPLKKGDYVHMNDPNLDRGQWKMGQIVGSRDEFERSVEIRLPSRKVITRPHNLIYKMEIPHTNEVPSSTPPPLSSSSSTHPMITRSKARHYFASLVLMMTCIQLVNTINTRCPEEMNVKKFIIYATSCVSQGIAIARYKTSTKEQFCWFPVTCPHGAIRFKGPDRPNPSLCGERCKCPPWSQFAPS
ncbi:hypothetical protein V3C99_018485 [Haemonchus contortus]|uniref:DUF5641 domain-containing protein n=1 Tax=Haemonchus contortus TaxID=6289 RepID=A0A7I4Z179_HAECO